MNKIELLAPAGDLFRGKIAILYGADAIYFGAKQYSLRARASNFEDEDIKAMIHFAHKHNKKAYIVANILCHNIHLNNLEEFIKRIDSYEPDGYIVADPAIIECILKVNPQASIHISTQQSITNSKAAKFFQRNKASRIVLAREISFQELKLMKRNIKDEIELEFFIHGAVCISYSGRCMLSNNFCMRDANIGGCAQSCRWNYKIADQNKEYDYLFSMSAKDMSLVGQMNKLIPLNLASYKIEGRMKTEHYIATLCKAYSNLLKEYSAISDNKEIISKARKEVNKVANRETSIAWFDGQPTLQQMLQNENSKTVTQNYAFIIKQKIDDDEFVVTSKNYFSNSDNFELMTSKDKDFDFTISWIKNEAGQEVKIVNQPNREYTIHITKKIPQSDIFDIARIK